MPRVPSRQSLRHPHNAYAAFFAERSRHPKFKSERGSRASAEFTRSAFEYRDGRLTLAKQTDPLDIAWSRPLPDGSEPSTVTPSREAAGRWHVAILVDDPTVRFLQLGGESVGIDAGISSPAAPSTGEKIENPHHEQAERKKLSTAQRALAR